MVVLGVQRKGDLVVHADYDLPFFAFKIASMQCATRCPAQKASSPRVSQVQTLKGLKDFYVRATWRVLLYRRHPGRTASQVPPIVLAMLVPTEIPMA